MVRLKAYKVGVVHSLWLANEDQLIATTSPSSGLATNTLLAVVYVQIWDAGTIARSVLALQLLLMLYGTQPSRPSSAERGAYDA